MKFCRGRGTLGNPRSARHGRRGAAFGIIALTAAGLLALAGGAPATLAADTLLRLATTTSTDNSGLLEHLLPEFKHDTGYTVQVIAVGTGKALRMGQNGDVDMVLVHARPAEERFIEQGHGINRREVMYNDFVIVGPPADPAGLRETAELDDALRRIADGGHVFISRGDDSGTHKKERRLWADAGLSPGGRWYREAGQGMGKVLQMSSELDAYALTDRGTWLGMKDKLALELLFEGAGPLHNPYGVIAVNPERHPHVDSAGAGAFIDWLTSPKAQHLIGDFRVNGERLFIPNAVNATTTTVESGAAK